MSEHSDKHSFNADVTSLHDSDGAAHPQWRPRQAEEIINGEQVVEEVKETVVETTISENSKALDEISDELDKLIDEL